MLISIQSGLKLQLKMKIIGSKNTIQQKMRVNDVKLNIGDKVYVYALPIFTEKLVNVEIVNFEKLIVEDILIEQ